MCDGLPLALVVLGGLLSLKPSTRNVWEKVLKTMVWSVDGKKCTDILLTSYDDMSVTLKSCFMYIASFPEDYEIDARHLIQIWIAEGFIPQESRKTLEDTAENYLEELAQRYVVIVVERRYDDSIKTIRVHDLLRELAIDRGKEENLITVFSNKDVNGSPSTVPRRVAFQSSRSNLLECTGSKLRSLHYFSDQVPDCSRYKMLKVCNMELHDDGSLDSDEIRLEMSTQLRFLRVAEGVIYLKPYVSQLKYLQTLDLKRASLSEGIPVCIWGIKTLCHVILPRDEKISGPPSWARLENLQTVGYIKDSVSWRTQLPHLSNVRHLKLIEPSSLETIASLFRTLDNLISLNLFSFDITAPYNMQPFPFYKQLQKLYLNAEWPVGLNLQTSMLPPYLIKLRLTRSYLKKDLMPALEKLQSLKILILDDAYTGQKMICSAGGFPCLQQLQLSSLHFLEQLEIEERAMPTLKLLKINNCSKLRSLPMHLTCCIEWKNNSCSLEDARGI